MTVLPVRRTLYIQCFWRRGTAANEPISCRDSHHQTPLCSELNFEQNEFNPLKEHEEDFWLASAPLRLSGHLVSNAVMASAPGHPFWRGVLSEIFQQLGEHIGRTLGEQGRTSAAWSEDGSSGDALCS